MNNKNRLIHAIKLNYFPIHLAFKQIHTNVQINVNVMKGLLLVNRYINYDSLALLAQ